MSQRYLGGLITKNPPTLNPALGNAANGIFTMDQYMQAVKAGTWPASDPYFENTVLLLHGNGTNGAQNNTFLDSSTNNFTITRNGNTTQGTFSPFSKPDGAWGNYFDGSGDYLQLSDNAAFDLSSGSWTIEAFVYAQSTSTRQVIIGKRVATSPFVISWYIQIQTSARVSFTNSSGDYYSSNDAVIKDAWNHIAVSYDGTNLSMFANGARVFGPTSVAQNNAAANIYIGGSTIDSFYVSGYLNSVRVVKGTQLYSGATYTVPTSPLTAIANTSLLTCQSNRFIDNSSNAFAITRNGDVKVTPFSPFPITTAYDPAVNGGAGYFDGSGDYLSVPNDAAIQLDNSTAFTIECWIYFNAFANQNILRKIGTLSPFAGYGLATGEGGAATNTLVFFVSGTGWTTVKTGLVTGQWYHFAATYEGSGTTLRFFLDGVQQGSAITCNSGILNTSQNLHISGTNDSPPTNHFTGYVSSLRIVKGTAVYTSAFTPPTAPVTAIANTSLLCNFTNAGVLDNTGFNALETVGNAQIDTTTKKYGTGSMEFDGTGDWLVIPASPHLIFSGSFTVEFWLYWNSVAASFNTLVVGTSANTQLFLNTKSNGTGLRFGLTGVAEYATGTKTWSTGQWYHIALVRNGSSIKFYVDGTDITDSTPTNTTTYSGILQIGGNGGGGTVDLNGFIDDLRITKGIARYTTTFTPPTSQVQDV